MVSELTLAVMGGETKAPRNENIVMIWTLCVSLISLKSDLWRAYSSKVYLTKLTNRINPVI